MAGEFAGTVAWDPFWQGSMGLSLGYHAKTGAFDPAAEGHEHREFYGSGIIITGDNAAEFFAANIESSPELDFEDLWGRASGQIMYE
jgi:ribose transport system substrate-binding protein